MFTGISTERTISTQGTFPQETFPSMSNNPLFPFLQDVFLLLLRRDILFWCWSCFLFFLWPLLCSQHSAIGGVSLAVERTRGRGLGLCETVLVLRSPMHWQEIQFIRRLKSAKNIDQYATLQVSTSYFTEISVNGKFCPCSGSLLPRASQSSICKGSLWEYS